MSKMPTVRFDPTRVTEAVKDDLWKNVLELRGMSESQWTETYLAALQAVSAGGDLASLFNALMRLNVAGMTRRRAEEIAHDLSRRATVFMDRERQSAISVTQAKWVQSGAPCGTDPKNSAALTAEHVALNGKTFDPAIGMLSNGKRIWPGSEPGCKCFAKSMISGFS
jgi:uncharacterized protein with gpF-like domain